MSTRIPSSLRIWGTKDYRSLNQSPGNRPLDLGKHRRLKASMEEYGFLQCYPVICHRKDGQLQIKDGQHRCAMAEELGLPVYYIEVTVDFDVATINCAGKAWSISDFARRWIAAGRYEYQEVLDFCTEQRIPITTAFSMLAGTQTFSNVEHSVRHGTFQIKEKEWANKVAVLYNQLIAIMPSMRGDILLKTCMACCWVEKFIPRRMVTNATRRKDLLAPYASRDGYLTILEKVYNDKCQRKIPLKFEATAAMERRNVCKRKNKKEAEENLEEAELEEVS